MEVKETDKNKQLETVDIPALEIFSEGKWNGDEYSHGDLQAMVDAFPQVGFEPTVKAGHADGQEDEKKARLVFGAPALGYAKRIWVDGKKLFAELKDIPKRFADLIKTKAFSRVSAEIYWNYKHEVDGKTYPRVLKSIAFLGADIPALTNLEAIESLYQKNEAGSLFAYDERGNEFRSYCMDCAVPMSPGMGLSDYLLRYPRKSKESAGYQESDGGQEKCGNCKFWIPGYAACSIVEGNIEPRYVSDYFELRSDLVATMANENSGDEDAVEEFAFCPTGEKGGIDNSCSSTEEGSRSTPDDSKLKVIGEGIDPKFQDEYSKIRVKNPQGAYPRANLVRIRTNGGNEIYGTVRKGNGPSLFLDVSGSEKPIEISKKDILDGLIYKPRPLTLQPSRKIRHSIEMAKKKDEIHEYTVEKRGDQWCLISKSDGKTLGCHDTEEGAMAQEQAIQANKHVQEEGNMTFKTHMTRDEIANICAPCGKKMEEKGISALTFTSEQVAKFAEHEDMEKCMAKADMVEKYPDENDRKTACGKVMGEAVMQAIQEIKGGPIMDEKKFQEEQARLVAEKDAAEKKAKQYQGELDALKASNEEAKSKESEALKEVKKLKRERYDDQTSAWIAARKREGKIAPVEESRLTAIFSALYEDQRTVEFSQDGKDAKKESLADAVKAFITNRPSLFKVVSNKTDEEGEALENVGDEVDRQTKAHMEKHNMKIEQYGEAMKAVLAQKGNEELADKWVRVQKQ